MANPQGAPGDARHVHAVDRIRGLAALAVTWFHLTNGYHDWVGGSGRLGWLGLDAFFVLSGFVIPYSLQRRGYRLPDFWTYLARRCVRIEPPYLASIALVLLLALAAPWVPGFHGGRFDITPLQVASHLLYATPLLHQAWLQPVYWTLGVEFIFYLVVGAAFPLLQRQWLLWSAALAVAALCCTAISGEPEPRVLLFLIGAAGLRAFARPGRALGAWLCIGAAVAVMSALGAMLSAAVAVMTVCAILFAPLGKVPLLQRLGAISYSLYLVHVPIGGKIVNLGGRFAHGPLEELAVSCLALAASLLAATALWAVVERPAMALSSRIGSRRPDCAPKTDRLPKAVWAGLTGDADN